MPPEVLERLAAMLLLTLVTGAACWVKHGAAATERITAQREEQLRTLRALQHGELPPSELQRCRDLFAGDRLVWQQGPVGPFLTMQPGEVRR